MKREIPQKVDAYPGHLTGSLVTSGQAIVKGTSTLLRRTRSSTVLALTLALGAAGTLFPCREAAAVSLLNLNFVGTMAPLPSLVSLSERDTLKLQGQSLQTSAGSSTRSQTPLEINLRSKLAPSLELTAEAQVASFSTTPASLVNLASGINPVPVTTPFAVEQSVKMAFQANAVPQFETTATQVEAISTSLQPLAASAAEPLAFSSRPDQGVRIDTSQVKLASVLDSSAVRAIPKQPNASDQDQESGVPLIGSVSEEQIEVEATPGTSTESLVQGQRPAVSSLHGVADDIASLQPTAQPVNLSKSDGVSSRTNLVAPSSRVVHQVKGGENLTEIAARYHIPPELIAQANRLDDPNLITVNEALVIPDPALLSLSMVGPLEYLGAETALVSAAAWNRVASTALVAQANPNPSLTPQGGTRQQNPAIAAVPSTPLGDKSAAPALPKQPYSSKTVDSAPAAIDVAISSRTILPPIPNLELPPLDNIDNFLPGNTKMGTQKYIWPARGLLTSGYGWRWGRMHRGIDVAAPIGTPVVASAPGVVTYAGWNDGGYGNLVKLRHPDGSTTLYGHNNRILTRIGMTVGQGQLIAEMGSTGRSTGPHVHFEIHPSGRGAVDPMFFLARS